MKTYLIIFACLACISLHAQENDKSAITDKVTPEQLAQMQLDAYNNGDIDAFLIPYDENVEIYTFPDQLNYKGKENMRKRYSSMFDNIPDLHCELVNRIVEGNTVIDHERVTGLPEGKVLNAIAIYTIENNKIKKVHFIVE